MKSYALIQTVTRHGNALLINGMGVIITGAPGIGKSTLSLMLIERGHALIADDATQLHIKNNQLIASAHATYSGKIIQRPNQWIDVIKTYGPRALIYQAPLTLMIHLISSKEQQSLTMQKKKPHLLNKTLKYAPLFISPDRPLADFANIVENIVLTHKEKGRK